LPTLSAFGPLAALVDLCRLHDEHRGRRRLHDEREALVRRTQVITTGIGRARLDLLRLGVERLAEFHDVEPALPERGSDRRAGIRLAGGNLQLM
jgi:hypothetical protein